MGVSPKWNAILLQLLRHFKPRTLLCSAALKTEDQHCFLRNESEAWRSISNLLLQFMCP